MTAEKPKRRNKTCHDDDARAHGTRNDLVPAAHDRPFHFADAIRLALVAVDEKRFVFAAAFVI
jgi:hypothetical protein